MRNVIIASVALLLAPSAVRAQAAASVAYQPSPVAARLHGESARFQATQDTVATKVDPYGVDNSVVYGAAIGGIIGVLLLGGGHWLVHGSVTLARRAGLSTLLIGLTLVAFGTSSPELFFNIIAALGGHSELSFGNVVGSNIANLGLILGVAALIVPLTVHGRVLSCR